MKLFGTMVSQALSVSAGVRPTPSGKVNGKVNVSVVLRFSKAPAGPGKVALGFCWGRSITHYNTPRFWVSKWRHTS